MLDVGCGPYVTVALARLVGDSGPVLRFDVVPAFRMLHKVRDPPQRF